MNDPVTKNIDRAERIIKLLQPVFQWLPNQFQKVDWFRRKRRKYIRRLRNELKIITIFGSRRTILLQKIFVKVKILTKVQYLRDYTPGQLEKILKKDEKGLGETQETKDGLEAIKSQEKVIVLGKPGAGKTTFLKYIALKTLEGELKENLIPIFVNLKLWSDSQKTLFDYIADRFEMFGTSNAQFWLKRMLRKGKFVLLLDGLDEVTGGVDTAIDQIKEFTEYYFDNQFVLSSRLAVYEQMFQHFTEIEIADFDDDQIQNFISNFCENT